jgi:DNA topoisomerase-2
MKKTIEQKYRKLDEISHVLLRPGRYLGSITPHTADAWTVTESGTMQKRSLTWTPALLKIFDEIISNSVDFSKTEEGKHLDTIKVDLNRITGEITVYDNGGIAVIKHSEYDQYIPEMIFELRSGSNFDDSEDSMATGQNGEGSALTAIFSSEFEVQTADGSNQFIQTRTDNSRKISDPKVKTSDKHFTKIRFIPDYEKFGLDGLDTDNEARLIKRVYDVAGCNPKLNVYLNGKRIKIASFSDYVKLYTSDFVHEENDHWHVALAASEDGFNHVSFVNGTETTTGGNHISYIADQITNKLRDFFKKKHKVDVKPGDIRNHMLLFIDAGIIRPRYSSQTKEDLITESKNFGTSIEISDKFIQKVIKSNIVQSVLDWVNAKAAAAEAAELRKKSKDIDKANLRKISKFTDATQKENRDQCMIFIAEGESAASSILSARTGNIGCYPLKGKPINAMAATTKDLLDNKEFTELMTVTGLKIGEKVKIEVDSLYEIYIDDISYIVSTEDIIIHKDKQYIVKDLI